MRKHYKVIWESPKGTRLADVSFTASSDAGIRQQVKRIAKQISFTTVTCQVLQNGRVIMGGFES